jgi:catechol 2,3-dioxygenase-like lactoylglutathione lyase family enzyme
MRSLWRINDDTGGTPMPSTRDVLDHHLQCFGAGDLEGTLADFAADSTLLTPDGAIRGLPGIREFFARVFAEFGQPGTTVTMRQLLVEGDCAFVCWDAETPDHTYEAASDTFLVRDGRIAVQTFSAKVMARNVRSDAVKEGSRFAPAPVGTRFGQVAWVVPDIQEAERFFVETLGLPGFAKLENVRAQDTAGTYLGEPGDFVFHLYMAYSGGALLELIQPVSGASIFRDFLTDHPAGGVQHVAYMVAEEEFADAVAELTGRGYPVVQALTLPVATVAFFDTSAVLGVATEIIGVTEAGRGFIAQLQSGAV